ncbi:MAG: glutamine cyclotransferase [Myxococcota bacterium]
MPSDDREPTRAIAFDRELTTVPKPALGLAHDGEKLWCASGDGLRAVDPATGDPRRQLSVVCDAGTAYDGRFLYQLAEKKILKVDPESGDVVHTIVAPPGGASGMAWAEGSLWVGQYRKRRIHRVDPESGEIVATIETKRFVTGISWVDGELWHGARDNERSEIDRLDPASGAVQERLLLPEGVMLSGLASDGERFFCAGGEDGKVRVVEGATDNPPGERKHSGKS